MFSVAQKRAIADVVQKVLRDIGHPELPDNEIEFVLIVTGAKPWSYAEIRNNGAVINPGINPHNEAQEARSAPRRNVGKGAYSQIVKMLVEISGDNGGCTADEWEVLLSVLTDEQLRTLASGEDTEQKAILDMLADRCENRQLVDSMQAWFNHAFDGPSTGE